MPAVITLIGPEYGRSNTTYAHLKSIRDARHSNPGFGPPQNETPMPLRTYLVEDNPLYRDMLRAVLPARVHLQVLGVSDSEQEGVNWLLTHPKAWDLVLVDLVLRQGSGFRVLAACRVRSATQKIIVLTSHASREVRQRCLDLGADAVFDKASELDEMLAYCTQRGEAAPTPLKGAD
jgi:two-component system, OmpR family, response regulator